MHLSILWHFYLWNLFLKAKYFSFWMKFDLLLSLVYIYMFSGNDLPSNEKFQMYPSERIVSVGDNSTFCCIVGESKTFGEIRNGNTVMNATRLSRRSYATTVVHQKESVPSGDNIYCFDSTNSAITGTVFFVGCKMDINYIFYYIYIILIIMCMIVISEMSECV